MPFPEFEKLAQVVKKLRHPTEGCPWDLEQTHQSLLPFLVEESYEFCHATEENDDREMEEELGDVLLQIMLHTTIGEEREAFSLESVSKKLADKMIRRHPHVFANPEGRTFSEEEIKQNWQEIKSQEKSEKEDQKSHIESDYLSYPSLLSSYKIGKKTREVNFDWDETIQVVYKVEEEWQELKEELAHQRYSQEKVEEELGDFLFSVAQLARHLKCNPEETLRNANRKFIRRFQSMEGLVHDEGKSLKELTQRDLDHYWESAKRLERNDQN